VTVWSLVTGGAIYIQYPIHPDKGYAFRKDGRYMALAERHRSKDTIGIYNVKEQFRLVRVSPRAAKVGLNHLIVYISIMLHQPLPLALYPSLRQVIM
jgi:hypothetical protein